MSGAKLEKVKLDLLQLFCKRGLNAIQGSNKEVAL